MREDVMALAGLGIGKKCICWGHGYSAERILHAGVDRKYQIIAVNTTKYCPSPDYLLAYDSPILFAIRQGAMTVPKKTKIIASYHWDGTEATYGYHVNSFPRSKTPKFSHFRSGLRAVYIASEIMRFDEVYLVGYDYMLHPIKIRDPGDVRTWENDNPQPIAKIYLDEQIEEFSCLQWTGKIYQTNSDSRLTQFPVKKL